MGCVKCRDLRQAFACKLRKYIEARTACYYRVSTELAAHKNVDMERPRNDLEEHQLVCASVVAGHHTAFNQHSKKFAVVDDKGCCCSHLSVIDQTWASRNPYS